MSELSNYPIAMDRKDDVLCACGHTQFWHQCETGHCLNPTCRCSEFRETDHAHAA